MIKIHVKISKFSKYQECIYLYNRKYIQCGEGEETREGNCSTYRIPKEIREDSHLLCLPEHNLEIKHICILSSTEEHCKTTSLISN